MNPSTPSAAPASAAPHVPSKFAQFYALTKPRVVQLIVFCALIGMVLAVPGVPTWPDVRLALIACAGIWLVAGAAAAFNCLVEQQIDARMRRTAWRPTAKGELSNPLTLAFSGALCALGSWILYVWVNPLTMWLTFATFIGYAVVYTVILKPMTPQNIVIGGASGAMPPVLGWAAMTGSVGPEALILFLIIFLWTPPHFWALALYRVEDYRKSGLPMLPVTHGNEFTRLQVFLVHAGAVSRLPDAVYLQDERLALPGGRRRAQHRLQLVRLSPVAQLLRRVGAQDLPLFADPSFGAVRGAAA
jgi:protoheme IX farnesyltransferase